MEFLTILVAVFFYRNWLGDNPLQKLAPFRRYQGWFVGRGLATHVRFVLCVGTPTVLVFWLAIEIEYWILGLLWLLLSLSVVIYSLEIYDATSLFDDQISWLRSMNEGDTIADNAVANVVQRHEDFVVVTVYGWFQSIIPVLFWFLLVGPAGSILYAMTTKYVDGLDSDDPEVDLAEQVVYWMEWLPMRLTGLLLAFLGNFGRGFEYWLEIVLDIRSSSSEHLAELANTAIDEPDKSIADDAMGFAKSAEYSCNELKALLERTIYGWLGIAALVTIIGW
jgi:AmpE protein